MRTVDDIDAMLVARKRLDARPVWARDERGSVAHLTVSIMGWGPTEGLTFIATALVYEPIQAGSCVLILERRPVQRLSFRPTHAHVNPPDPRVSRELRGLRMPAGGSRLYPWSANRNWPRARSDNVSVGQPLLPDAGSLDMALAIFLDICNIDGEIPPAPWEPRLL